MDGSSEPPQDIVDGSSPPLRAVKFDGQVNKKPNESVEPSIRLAIANWPDDAPRGAVASFCAAHEISRSVFYKIRARARDGGQAAALEPQSRRPHTSPGQISEDLKDQACQVRAALKSHGYDHGPISVHDKMKAMGLDAPSIASLARIFRERGVAKKEPRKKPRAAFQRFVYPAPNACWQLDATEYTLKTGVKCVIFQLIDDHSRLAIASLVAKGETSTAALQVVQQGIATHGAPQRLLSDNGVALNPSRRGYSGDLVKYLNTLGVTAITGKPYKPTTQGKVERIHQTLFKHLDACPRAATIYQLQHQVNDFDHWYNTERGHQGLPERMTPQQAWDATPVADPPHPPPFKPAPLKPAPTRRRKPGAGLRIVQDTGTIMVGKVRFNIGTKHAGRTVHATWNERDLAFYTTEGVLIMEHTWPPDHVAYVPRPATTKPQISEEPPTKS